MRDARTIKLAVGIAGTRAFSAEEQRELGTLAYDLSEVFHRKSSCFSKVDASPVLARRKLLRASVFESYRVHWDYFVLVANPQAISVPRVLELVQLAEREGSEVLAALPQGDSTPTPTRFDLALLRKSAVDRLLEAGHADTAFGELDETAPDRVLLETLSNLGCKFITETESAEVGSLSLSPQQPYRLPLDVDFFPTSGGGTRLDTNLDEIRGPLRTAVGTLAEVAKEERVAIWGAGLFAESAIDLLGDRVVFAVDRNEELHAKPFHDKPVYPPEQLIERRDEYDAVLVTAVGRESEITGTLIEMLGSDARIYALDGTRHPAPSDTPEFKRRRGVSMAEEEEAIEEGNQFVPYLIDPAFAAPERPATTTVREVTRRAVLYTGFPCNIRCIFCYYTYVMDGAQWHPIEETKRDATLYREVYGNDSVDITGGEPTAYPHILELVEHCSEIGLRPTLITNMRNLARLDHAKGLQEAGTYDFLCSVHALGRAYDYIAQTRNGWEKLTKGLDNINKLGMKWRTNCTMTTRNMKQLRKIVEFSFMNGSRAINFINYNPFYEWQSKMDIDFQARHSEVAPYLREALDYCDEIGMEANVRYFPFCHMKGHEDKCYNYDQLSYDPHEWDYNSWYSAGVRNPSAKYPTYLPTLESDDDALHIYQSRRTRADSYASCSSCDGCSVREACDGFTRQYAERFGTGETQPYRGEPVKDPTHFIRQQLKIVDE